MPTDSGRKRDPAWDEVVDLTDPETNKVVKVACKRCNVTISAKIERVKAHIGK